MRLAILLLLLTAACGPGAQVRAGGVAMSGAAFVPSGTSSGQSVGIRYKEHSGFLARVLVLTLESAAIHSAVNPGRKTTSLTSESSSLRTDCAGGTCTTYRVTTTTTTVSDNRSAEEVAADSARMAELNAAATKRVYSKPVGIETTLDVYSTKLGGDTSGISYYAIGTGDAQIVSDSLALRTSFGLAFSRLIFHQRDVTRISGNVGGSTTGGAGAMEQDQKVWMLGFPVRLNLDLGHYISFYSQIDLNALTAFAALTADEGEALPPTTVRLGIQLEFGPVALGVGTISNSLDTSSTSFQGDLLVGF